MLILVFKHNKELCTLIAFYIVDITRQHACIRKFRQFQLQEE
jgi:hypothetical protein